jgi:lysophospholipase L1-like esterase
LRIGNYPDDVTFYFKNAAMSKHIHSLLCLGDSYTIGEGVPLHQSFPYQVVQLLRKQGHLFHAPEIVAQTGWTTTELAEFLIHHSFEQQYDFVTLLIGVNNQYRDMEVEDFADDFEYLLKKAISLCSEHEKQVMVISIPDWGITPFAKAKNSKKIAEEINTFNTTASLLAAKYNVAWLDIRDDYRKTGGELEMLAADGLHPSGSLFSLWAEEISVFISEKI